MSENRISSKIDQQYEFNKNQQVHIRWMIRRDMPEVLEIEDLCSGYPWSEERFLTHLRESNCIGMVAEVEEIIVGFMIYELNKKSLYVTTLAVHPKFWRMGIGRQMIEKLIGKLSTHRRTYLQLYVRETSLNAQKFFHSCGLKARLVIREYFEDSGEDAYMMRYIIK